MANITLNGLSNPSNLVTFTEIPNILKVTEPVVGDYAEFSFHFQSTQFITKVTGDSQFYVTFLGESVTNVMNPSNPTNKRFYIGRDTSATAASFCNALRNCGSISAQFIIYLDGSQVILKSKTIGPVWSNYPNFYTTNIATSDMFGEGRDGSTTSEFANGKITVDVINSDIITFNKYVTTLEKNFYDGECAFDISPVLSTFSEYGELQPYTLKISLHMADGEYKYLGYITAHSMIGYSANQSDKYLYGDADKVLINTNRDDGITLYTYENEFPVSVLVPKGTGGITLTLECYNSIGEKIYNTTNTRRIVSGERIVDVEHSIPEPYWSQTHSITVTESTARVSFKVIKPLKATEGNQRVYWRNCYGGISFFDFCGRRSESDSVDIETYEKNVFDYYDSDAYERKMIYSNDYKKKVSLTSHLMEKSGTYIFNDLMRSKRVWTYINNKLYYIIPTSIEVNENDSYNDIYECTFKYEYSDI